MGTSENTNELVIRGSVVYHAGYFSDEEKYADITITFWKEGYELAGIIHFVGHETWNADIPPTSAGDSFPDSTVLREYAREVLCRYMGAWSYIHRNIKLNLPR